jgi:hypothetical protein
MPLRIELDEGTIVARFHCRLSIIFAAKSCVIVIKPQ